ncbi:hypothetical protein F5Y16DRAFT_423243 [Xylariaceae sp. FL0255]|nr:hypothetical protein F5Y16DRAFT_423243 [Xylariaceae sp. FL0255]
MVDEKWDEFRGINFDAEFPSLFDGCDESQFDSGAFAGAAFQGDHSDEYGPDVGADLDYDVETRLERLVPKPELNYEELGVEEPGHEEPDHEEPHRTSVRDLKVSASVATGYVNPRDISLVRTAQELPTTEIETDAQLNTKYTNDPLAGLDMHTLPTLTNGLLDYSLQLQPPQQQMYQSQIDQQHLLQPGNLYQADWQPDFAVQPMQVQSRPYYPEQWPQLAVAGGLHDNYHDTTANFNPQDYAALIQQDPMLLKYIHRLPPTAQYRNSDASSFLGRGPSTRFIPSSRPPSVRPGSIAVPQIERPAWDHFGRELRNDKLPRKTHNKLATEVIDPERHYGRPPKPPNSWGPKNEKDEHLFTYSEQGELWKGKFFTKREMRWYLMGPSLKDAFDGPEMLPGVQHIQNKTRQGLTLWICWPAAMANDRFPRKDQSCKCRFKDCEVSPQQHTIHQGQPMVIFDERQNTVGEAIDPFFNAGYVHLFCLCWNFDLVELWSHLDIRLDFREFKREACSLFKLDKAAPGIGDIVKAWWRIQYPVWEARRHKRRRRHQEKDTSLVDMMVAHKLRYETPAAQKNRLKRGGIDLAKYLGNPHKKALLQEYKKCGLLDWESDPIPGAAEELERLRAEGLVPRGKGAKINPAVLHQRTAHPESTLHVDMSFMHQPLLIDLAYDPMRYDRGSMNPFEPPAPPETPIIPQPHQRSQSISALSDFQRIDGLPSMVYLFPHRDQFSTEAAYQQAMLDYQAFTKPFPELEPEVEVEIIEDEPPQIAGTKRSRDVVEAEDEALDVPSPGPGQLPKPAKDDAPSPKRRRRSLSPEPREAVIAAAEVTNEGKQTDPTVTNDHNGVTAPTTPASTTSDGVKVKIESPPASPPGEADVQQNEGIPVMIPLEATEIKVDLVNPGNMENSQA